MGGRLSSWPCSVSSVLVVVISVALLLNAGTAVGGCYKRIFSFGDSIIDTGNFAYFIGNGPSRFKELPFGMTFFHRATGRISDGRVLVDFYAQALGLPLLPPSSPQEGWGNFSTGANFAVFGSTALPPEYFVPRYNLRMHPPSTLDRQLDSFKGVLNRIAPGDRARKALLSESLVIMGEIGGNDYNFWFFGDRKKPRETTYKYLPDVVARIGAAVQELINLGATTILVPGNFPIGCVPAYLARKPSGNPGDDYDEHGCLKWYNDFSQRHNAALRQEVSRLRWKNPGARLIYADYYGAAMEFVKNPRRYGIGDPLVACCGGEGRYHTEKECGSAAKVWGNPAGFASWDGMHMTEKAYSVIAQGVLDGPYADIPLRRSCPARLS
ncbi:GDSL esterase/lipase At1g28600 [Brachypodium distachyon]|nr:GDSL esterase/lipase At1g28600 [Brachypodium distachyon]|eukprot:XP_014755903.1 GDSL esterase/lipase At1g28600 [Brachypodium distachyon]